MRTGHQNKFNNNNRQQSQNRNGNRNRGGQGGGKGNSLNRAYESNGPGIKLRGTAHHIAERYVTLARDAQSAGDTIAYEGYMQHAEHYLRLIAANNEILKANNPNFRPAPLPGSIHEEFEEDEAQEEDESTNEGEQPDIQGEPFQPRPQHQNQHRRRFDNSSEAQPAQRQQESDKQQGERPQGEQREPRRERFQRERFNRDPQSQAQPSNNSQPTGEFRRERRPYPPQVQQPSEQPNVELNYGLPAFLTTSPQTIKPEQVTKPEINQPENTATPRRGRGRPKFQPKTELTEEEE